MLVSFFGAYGILILIGILTHTYILLTIIGVLWTAIDIWKVRYYKSKGKRFTFSGMTENK